MEFLKGFLAIKLSDNEYFSILNLDDVAVKKVTLGKFKDETNIKLDFYISEYKDFSNSIFIGSFFLDNLRKESSNVNIYCRIASMVLYVYGECSGITNKSKFDLKLIKLGTNSTKELIESLNGVKLDDLFGSLSDLELENENGVDKKSEGILVQSKEDYLNVDDIDNLKDTSSLLMDEKFSSDKSNLNLSSNSLSSDNYKLSDEDLTSKFNLNLSSRNLDIGVVKDRFGTSLNEGSKIRHIINENNTVNKDTSDLGDISVDVNDVSTYSDDFDNFNVESIMTDFDKEFVEDEFGSFDNIDLDDFGDQDFTVDFENSKSSLSLEKEEGFIQTSMLYLSLVSLFLLIFFSLFLIFSKVLNHRNFTISYFSFYKEEKIHKYEKNNYV